jgi:hypothetical protein
MKVDWTFGTITMPIVGVTSPAVVDHVVAKISCGILAIRCHTRNAASMMRPEIVVNRYGPAIFGG